MLGSGFSEEGMLWPLGSRVTTSAFPKQGRNQASQGRCSTALGAGMPGCSGNGGLTSGR